MSNHRYNTRLASGTLKRRTIYNSDNSSGDSSDDSLSDSEIKSIIDKNELQESDYDSDNNKFHDRIEYYKFLNKLFPSNYSKSKIKKVKRQRLRSPDNNILLLKNNHYKKPKFNNIKNQDYENLSSCNETNYEIENQNQNQINDLLNNNSINKLLSNKNSHVNLVFNLNKKQNNIYNDTSYNNQDNDKHNNKTRKK